MGSKVLEDDKLWDPNQSCILSWHAMCTGRGPHTMSFGVNTGRRLCLREPQSPATSPYNRVVYKAEGSLCDNLVCSPPTRVTCAESDLCQLCRPRPFAPPANVCPNHEDAHFRCPSTASDPSVGRRLGPCTTVSSFWAFNPHQEGTRRCMLLAYLHENISD